MAVPKAHLIQGLLSLYRDGRYLEVGVAQGRTFHMVTAARKVAVDPKFRFNVAEAKSSRPEATYHEVPSDSYFGGIVEPTERFDVIYLDGLHTFEQTLRDFNNAIHFLSPKGVVVIDDVVPSSYFAAVNDLKRFRAIRGVRKDVSDAWMGDVYRLVYFIDSFHQQYSYRTTSDNLGQLVVWPARRNDAPQRTVEATARATYEDLLLQPETFRYAASAEIVAEVGAWIEAPDTRKPA